MKVVVTVVETEVEKEVAMEVEVMGEVEVVAVTVDMAGKEAKVVQTEVVVVKHDPDINTSILRNMERESMCCYKMLYNEGLEEDKVVLTAATVATEEAVMMVEEAMVEKEVVRGVGMGVGKAKAVEEEVMGVVEEMVAD